MNKLLTLAWTSAMLLCLGACGGRFSSGRSSLPDAVVGAGNRGPVASAGVDQVVEIGVTVQLDGSGSRDVDGDLLRYRWHGPSGITLSSETEARPQFVATTAGRYRFALVVNDGQVDSGPDTVEVRVREAFQGTALLPGGAQMEMVWIEGGKFTMGSPGSDSYADDDEKPQHQVTLSKGFYLGKNEITQGQWSAVMGTRPWSGQDHVVSDPNNPAVYISWDDLQVFIHRLNVAAGDSLYRLPTETEWEYACRAGTTTRWSFGDDEGQLADYAWYYGKVGAATLQSAQPVGAKLPNPWGLDDMHGNVWEWVQDWYGAYPSGAQTDPRGPPNGSDRVRRGGGFVGPNRYVRSAHRDYGTLGDRYDYLGARLVRMGPAPKAVTPQSGAEVKGTSR